MLQRNRVSVSSIPDDDGQQDNKDSVTIGQMPPTPSALQALEMGLAMTYLQTNCPPGLEHLLELNRLLLNEGKKGCHYECCCGTKPFTLMDSLGQRHYTTVENSSTCQRLFCMKARSFCIRVKDIHYNTVMCARRSMKVCNDCDYTCSDCCVQEICVEAPEGNTIGYVRYVKSRFSYTGYVATDSDRNHLIRIGGYTRECCPSIECSCPKCDDCSCDCKCQPCDCCRGPDSVYELVTVNGGDHIGDLTRFWPGHCTKVNNYGLDFPVDLDVKVKATLIGAVFLINFVSYA